MLGEEQAGFRSNYSITDNVYVLKSIIDVYLKNSKRLYCAFIDYKKAFDLVGRAALWVRMFRMGVKGKIFNVIRNMYRCAKSCVANKGDMSSLFTCNIGVRQGENLSPLLFAIYLNDFQQSIGNSYKGLEFFNTIIINKLPFDGIEIYKDLFSLLYADDTIIRAETPEELQKALNAVKDYCDTWHLTVNASKTKIVVFSRGKVRRIQKFVYDGGVLEVVYDFVYLGVTSYYNGNFKKAIAKQVTQARKAMYSMLVKATWSNRICTNYRMFKNELVYEKYLQILCQKEAIALSKFRCRTHRLPVNKGRFDANVVDDLQCPLCTPTDIGDEFHYIFVCPFF